MPHTHQEHINLLNKKASMQTLAENAKGLNLAYQDLSYKHPAMMVKTEYQQNILDLHESLAAVNARLEKCMDEMTRLREQSQATQLHLALARAEIEEVRTHRQS